MNTMMAVGMPGHTLLALARHFEERGEEVDLGKVVGEIVEAWLADRGRAAVLARAHGVPDDDIPRGYHWKELFLPEGTLLRLYIFGPDERAVVVGDRLMYCGEPVSPNGFVRLFKHVPCNAWENLTVLSWRAQLDSRQVPPSRQGGPAQPARTGEATAAGHDAAALNCNPTDPPRSAPPGRPAQPSARRRWCA